MASQPEDERMLRRRLVEINALSSRPAYFSGGEREKIRAIEKQLVDRLSPIDPLDLDKKAADLLTYHASEDCVAWVQQALSESLP